MLKVIIRGSVGRKESPLPSLSVAPEFPKPQCPAMPAPREGSPCASLSTSLSPSHPAGAQIWGSVVPDRRSQGPETGLPPGRGWIRSGFEGTNSAKLLCHQQSQSGLKRHLVVRF